MTPRTTPSDNDLVRRIRKGEGDAAASLRARHWAAVFDFALRMTASVTTARTITDEVFAAVLIDPPDSDESFLSWAFASAHRQVMAQSEDVPTSSVELDDDVEVVVDLRDDAAPIDETLAMDVWDAMTRLDRQTQAVIDLHLRQGLDPSELAPILGISRRDAAEAVQDMKRTAAETIAAELLVADAEHACPELLATTTDADARAHVASCVTCTSRRSARYSPLQILGALKVVPAGPIDVPILAPVPSPARRLRRVGTPLGLLAILAGVAAIALVGVLAWDGILQPIGERVIQVVRQTPATTTLPPATTSAPLAPAVAADDAAQTMEDQPIEIDVLANDGSGAVDGSVTITVAPEHGELTVIGSTVRYVPEPDYNGADTFIYTLAPVEGEMTQATVSISIIPTDDAPVTIRFNSIESLEDEPVTIALADWASDADGDALTVVAFDAVSAEGGVVSESLVYTPPEHFFGVDSFGVTISDGTTELSFPVLLSVVSVNDVPDGPRALALETDEDLEVALRPLDGWSDADGDELTVALDSATTAAGGSVSLVGGTLTYTPAPEFSGEDAFGYRVSDGTETLGVTVTVAIADVADPPVVTSASFTVREDALIGTQIGTLRATDPEGDAFTFRIGQSTSPVSVSPSGRVALIESVDHEATPRILVSTVVVDSTGASSRFDMVIRVTDVDEAPTGRDQQLLVAPFAAKGATVGKVVVTDPEGATLTFTELNGDPSGAVNVAKNGIVRTAQTADPSLYPITVSVEAADPGGKTTTVLVVIRLDDFDAPDVGTVQVSEDEVWEQRPNGQGCQFGPSRSEIAVAVADSSGIASATIEWSAVFDGVPLSGSTRMAISGGIATGSFTFFSGLVAEGGQSVLTASIVVVDRAGNRTTTSPFTITVKSCAV